MSDIEIFYNELLILSSRIVLISLVLPIVIAIWQWKHLNKPLKFFFLYKVCSVLFTSFLHGFVWYATKYYDSIEPVLACFDIQNTNFLEILFYINDYILLGWFFYLLLGPKPYGNWIWRIAMLLLTTNIINYLFIEGHIVFGVFNPTTDAIFVFGVAAFYLWHLYRSQLALPLSKNPYFWISFGLIIPHLIGFFLFMVGDVTQEENFPVFVMMSVAKNGFLILSQVFYAIGFWRARYAKYIPLPPG